MAAELRLAPAEALLQLPGVNRSMAQLFPLDARSVGVFALALWTLGGCNSSSASYLSHEELLDAQSCQQCHPKQYQDWSSSMHAHASDDPIFRAMNQRGQREAGIGDFCVKCHAPMAVREGATVDGLNLDTVPQPLKGITCYFCHSVDGVADTHNNPLQLASDGLLRGPYADPFANPAHPSAYSILHDRDQL
ncbi:MAG TPA: multiheme c-type cytochrome, partial [Polyangiaceae bacterium]|nr:multiheme c-type cytochrome [Polyangiaceae bacterium]